MYPQSPDEDIRFVELVIGSCELPLGSGNQTDPPEKQPVFWTSKSSTEKKKKRQVKHWAEHQQSS